MAMCRNGWTGVAVLAVLLAAGTGNTAAEDGAMTGVDARTAIALESHERAMVLSEMRVFLASVQQVAAAIVADDLPGATAAARRSGRAAQHAMPASLAEKLPLPFRQLGMDTHTRFDALALDAEQLGDREHALSQLADLLGNCVSCHATYRFE